MQIISNTDTLREAIQNITMKIEDLRENLLDFESKIQGTLKEIPKDVRSYNNNSNFNASSSRYRVLEAE